MNMSVKIAGVEWKNPVTVASGTFGSGEEFSEFVDLNRLGAVTTKGVANVPWAGNPTPRVAEVYGGMMNAIGLQNPGIDLFCERDIPYLKNFDTKIIVNVCGHAPEEYLAVVERLADEPIDMMEINISCPNVKEGGIAFGQNPKAAEEITRAVKKYAKQLVKENEDFRKLLTEPDLYYEETLLRGYIIGMGTAKEKDFDKALEDLKKFVPLIDNWAVNDGFCVEFRIMDKYRQEFLPFLEKCILSEDEFEARAGLIMLLDHYIKVDADGNKKPRMKKVMLEDIGMCGDRGRYPGPALHGQGASLRLGNEREHGS